MKILPAGPTKSRVFSSLLTSPAQSFLEDEEVCRRLLFAEKGPGDDVKC